MTEAVVLGGVRTPFTRYGSSLSHIRARDLLGLAMNGAFEHIGVGLDQNGDVIAGCANPAHEGKGDAPSAPRGPVVLLDTMWSGAGGLPNPKLLARNAYISVIETAQNVADRYSPTREEIDAFALRSQQHVKAARDSGRLAKAIMPVQIPATKKSAGRMASLV